MKLFPTPHPNVFVPDGVNTYWVIYKNKHVGTFATLSLAITGYERWILLNGD